MKKLKRTKSSFTLTFSSVLATLAFSLSLSSIVCAASPKAESAASQQEDSAAGQQEDSAASTEEDSGEQRSTLLLNTAHNAQLRPISSSLPQRLRPKRDSDRELAHDKYKAGFPCVPLMLVDDPNTLIVCDREAGIKAENRTITLTHGKGIYMVGKHPIVVETPLGRVTLAGNSAAIIEQNESGLLRVDHLTGAASSVAVKHWNGVKAFSASSGEEICLAPKSITPDELVPKDGVVREEISTEVGDGGIRLAENKFVPKSLIDKECLLQCDSNSFFQVRRKVYQLRRSVEEQENALGMRTNEAQKQLSSMPLLIEGEHTYEVAPVTFSEPAVVQPAPLGCKQTADSLVKYLTSSDIHFDHPEITELRKGEALFLAKKTTFVKTPDSMIRVEPGTLALVSVNSGVTKVRNLWENKRNGLSQTVDQQPFHIAAGDEAISAGELRSVYLSASRDMVGRRLTHYTELPNGSVVHFAEVSLMSLAQSNDLLMQLMNSNDPLDKSLDRKVNKMAAILVQISASHGLYELMQPPQWRRDSKSSFLPVLY